MCDSVSLLVDDWLFEFVPFVLRLCRVCVVCAIWAVFVPFVPLFVVCAVCAPCMPFGPMCTVCTFRDMLFDPSHVMLFGGQSLSIGLLSPLFAYVGDLPGANKESPLSHPWVYGFGHKILTIIHLRSSYQSQDQSLCLYLFLPTPVSV